jgi:chromate transporter
MVLVESPRRFRRGASPGPESRQPPSSSSAMAVASTGTAFKVLTGLATGGTLVALDLFFVKAGAFIFGSGLAIVPFLREGVVNQHH